MPPGVKIIEHVQFQSTLPRRERRVLQGVSTRPRSCISIHAPAKGATHTRAAIGAWTANFNPRSREGSDTRCSRRAVSQFNFNPRSREGSDGQRYRSSGLRVISIHAPVKGATRSEAGNAGYADISIHTPAKGATRFGGIRRQLTSISIHAPAKGATSEIRVRFCPPGFQSTLP